MTTHPVAYSPQQSHPVAGVFYYSFDGSDPTPIEFEATWNPPDDRTGLPATISCISLSHEWLIFEHLCKEDQNAILTEAFACAQRDHDAWSAIREKQDRVYITDQDAPV